MKKSKKYCRDCLLITPDGGCTVLESPDKCETKINKQIVTEVVAKSEKM